MVVSLLTWDMWRYGRPKKSPDWDSDVGLKAQALLQRSSANTTWESLALKVMGQEQSGVTMSLFLEDWELAKVAMSCHIALDMLCREMHEAW